ncbi:MAG: hemagglutinin repeat-containing protein, partial [Rickettsiales bacterium]
MIIYQDLVIKFIIKIKSIDLRVKFVNFIKYILILSLIFSHPLSIANSLAEDLPITPDGSTNTQMGSAANGVPIVNIATPTSSGLSHNKFTDYNVNPSGLIINNATGNSNQVVQTGIGGLITDNPNLANSGSASVILNEVTSTNKSLLNGYTEIGGKQADLIIANPNGIEMNSAGFINIGRLTAVVGSANQFNGDSRDLSFNLNSSKNSGNDFLPKLTISGLGIDVTRVTETDLVANIMEIVSPIYGGDNRINFRAGDKEFNYNTKEVTSDNTNPGSNQPDEVAIDASNIAKIQAGQIYMVATKEGFGVKYTGDMLASRAGVTIDAKGNIVYNNIAAEAGDIEVKTTNGDITATGITHARGTNSDVTLDADRNISNEGQLVSARNINITAGNNFENKEFKDNFGNSLVNLSDNNFIINAKEVSNSGILFANKDLTLTNASLLTNNGQILANNYLDLTSEKVTNANLMIAGNKVNITATDFLTNDGDILSLAENLVDENLLPDTALTINAKTLNNNKQIAANSAIAINSNDLNNNSANSQIISGKNIELNITNLNNDLGTIDSRDVLKIRNLTTNNSEAALLLAVSDTKTSISNAAGYLKGTNAIDIDIGSSDYDIEGILETDGYIDIIAGNIANNGNFLPFAKQITNLIKSRIAKSNNETFSLNDLDGDFSGYDLDNLSSEQAITILKALADKIIEIDNGIVLTSDKIGDEAIALLQEISSDSITESNSLEYLEKFNQIKFADDYPLVAKKDSNVLAGDYIKLVASGTFDNGFVTGLNSNIGIAAGTYLDITAENSINNYGTLSSKTDLTLSSQSGNINNYAGAELIAGDQDNPGTSNLTLEAINGAINQYSKNSVVVNGDHTITANDYTNTGRIDIAGTLTMNITNNLINEIGALIYAGNNMYLNIFNNLTNQENATIYAENDLFIKSREFTEEEQSSFKMLSTDISTLNMDISSLKALEQEGTITQEELNELATKKLEVANKRLEVANLFDNLRIKKLENISGNIESYEGDIYIATNIFSNIRSEYRYVEEKTLPGWQWTDHPDLSSLRRNIIGNIVNQSIITAGDNVTINSDSFYNKTSSIYAQNDITIKSNSFTNQTLDLYATTNKYIGGGKGYCPGTSYAVSLCYGGGSWYYRQAMVPNGYSERYTANIKAGNNLLGEVAKHINNDTIIDDYSDVIVASNKNLNIVNGIDINNLLNTGKVDKDLSGYLNGPDNQGMFTKNPNPNGPLFETRSEFVDQSKFFGSDYFYQKIGLDLTDVQTQLEQNNSRLVGDQFFQTKIIEEQLKTITKNSFLLSQSETDVNNEIQSLLDNAADEYARLGLSANEILTQSQIDNLEKDIVWFETETINGELYVVPKIYLSKATRENLQNNDSISDKATMFAGADLILNSTGGEVKNTGSINAGNNININTSGNIINDNFSDISAGNNLSLVSSAGGVINKSKLQADETMFISAATDVYNIASVKTNDSNLLNEFSGTSPYATNNATARDSGNISSKLIENASIASGNLIISAGNDFNNYGSDITTTGNTTINAGNNVNISTVKLRNRSEYSSKKYTSITDETKNIGSNIDVGGNLALSANNDTLIKGSNLNVDGNATINTSGDLNIVSATDSYYNFEATKKKSSFGRGSSSTSTTNKITNVESNINVAGDINSTSEKNINIIASSVISDTGNINLIAKENVNILSGQDFSETIITSQKSGLTTRADSTKIEQNTRQVSSDIKATSGSLSIASGNNTNILASNLDAASNVTIEAGRHVDDSGTVTTNLDAKVNILSAKDKDYSYAKSSKTSLEFNDIEDIAKTVAITSAAVNFGFLAPGTAATSRQASALKLVKEEQISESLKETVVSSNITSTNNGNINISSGSDTTILASNLRTSNGGDININVGELIDGSGTVVTNDAAKVTISGDSNKEASYSQNQTIEFAIDFEPDGFSYANYQNDKNKDVKITNISSNLDSANNININTKSALSIEGSDITTANGNINLTSANSDIIIASGQNYQDSLSESDSGKLGINISSDLTIEVGEFEITEENKGNVTNAASNLNANQGTININSNRDTTLLASNLNADNGANITAGNNVNILNSFDQSWHETSSKKGTKQLKFETTSNELSAKSGITYTEEKNKNTSKTVASSSVIANQGDINSNSSNDTNIVASNLVASNDIDLTATNNLNILSDDQISNSSNTSLMVDAGIRAGIDHNLGQAYKTFENLGDIDVGDTITGTLGIVEGIVNGEGLDG